jgi:hypothetical protein
MAQLPGSSWTEGPYVAPPIHVRLNYRIERRVNHRLPSSGVGASGVHAER